MNLSILKYCPHCDAPMTPTSYEFCIGDNQKCTCCVTELPADHKFDDLVCSVCDKTLTEDDFRNKNATYTHDQIICLECLRAKRILQKDKEIYNCDFCGEELTQLDFLEDNADIKRMLIVCKSCQNKHFKDDKQQSEKADKEAPKVEKSEAVEKKIVSETAQSLMKAVQSTVRELEEAEKRDSAKKEQVEFKPSKVEDEEKPETPEIVEETEKIESKTEEKPEEKHKSIISKRINREKQTAQAFDYRAALGCLVVIVIFLSAGIAFLIYNKYANEKDSATEELTNLISSINSRQNDLADSLERFGNRLYHLEQLEMERSREPKNNTTTVKPDEKTETPEVIPEETPEDTVRVSPKMREILDKLDSNVESEKLNAIMDISWENYHGATPKLIEILQNETDKYIRVFAIITLVSFREKDAIPVLKDIVFREKESIVTETAQQAIIELEKFSR